MMAASRDVALLLLTLQEPGSLPSYVIAANDPDIDRTIGQLLLDGVLEMEIAGAFVSGAAALRGVSTASEQDGHIAKISRDAVMYASMLDTESALDIEARLYMYNQAPLTPAWSSKIPNRRAVRSFLGVDHGPTATLINECWRESDGDADAWIQWISTETRGTDAAVRSASYKVYVSPVISALPDAFATTVRILADAGVAAFKVGATPRDLARPDKLVAYFRTRERALECARVIADELVGLSAQGVPFSASVGDAGLVSWGMDPADQLGRPPETSWRRWICRRIAHYIAFAAATPNADVPAWQFALERLRLDGVDTTRWEPDEEQLNRATWGSS